MATRKCRYIIRLVMHAYAILIYQFVYVLISLIASKALLAYLNQPKLERFRFGRMLPQSSIVSHRFTYQFRVDE